MRIPDSLTNAIDAEVSRGDPTAVSRASAKLSDEYRNAQFASGPLNSVASQLAYLRVRLPATYAANLNVFREIESRLALNTADPEGVAIRSVLDLGAGPGTAMWAAASVFSSVEKFTLFERNPNLIEIGRRLAFSAEEFPIRSAHWIQGDLTSGIALEKHDMVVVSYALGELSSSAAEALIRSAWLASRNFLVIVEPGTPRNFQRVLASRTLLLGLGAHPVAPCPHALSCPLAANNDWCHFSQRLERTSEHRRMKGGSLGYEDEKFSYFVASRNPVALPDSRIVRHPLKHPGHVQLMLCTAQGIQRDTVGKSKPSYKLARKAEWGSFWQRSSTPVHP